MIQHQCGLWPSHLNLGTDSLETRCEGFDLLFLFPKFELKVLLLLGNSRFQFLHSAVLFEKLVKQHRVNRFVADGVDVALGVMGHQVGVHLRHFLGYEAELRDPRLIQLGLVTEGHGTQSQERLTGGAHVGDVRLEPARREKDAQLALIVYVTGGSTRTHSLARDAGDVRRGLGRVADADGARITGDPIVADVDIVAARDIGAGFVTDGRVVPAGGSAIERIITDGRVEAAGGIVLECTITDGRVRAAADGVAKERLVADGRVEAAGGVEKESERSISRVFDAGGVA